MFTETEASDCFSIIAQVLFNSVVNSVKKESMHIFCYNSVDYPYKINRQFEQVYVFQSTKADSFFYFIIGRTFLYLYVKSRQGNQASLSCIIKE